MPLLDYNAFGGMESKTKQKVLREYRMAAYAKNTRLWDGSIRAYKSPKKLASCTDNYVLDKNIKPVCTTCCASYFKSPCGEKCLYSLKDCKIARNGRVVGLNRPTQTPVATLISGAGNDSVMFRVLCTNEHGEYSAPSANTKIIEAKYGAVISLQWDGCTPYKVEALLTQSLTHTKEIGKDPSQWVSVGEFEASKANIVFKPEYWELTGDGFDPMAYCDPPTLDCFVVTDEGFFVGWKGGLIFVSERHEPSKFIRSAIKNLHTEIYNIVAAGQALYISTADGIYIARIAPDKDGVSVSIIKTYENIVPIKNTLSLVNSGAVFATRYGLYTVDERGGTPQNITSKLVPEDEFEKTLQPVHGTVQRGVFYGTKPDGESWHIDFPSTSGDASEYGKLVLLDSLGKNIKAGQDGSVYYSLNGQVNEFDRGDKYLEAIWESNVFTAPARASFSKYKVVGQNLEGIVLSVFVDGNEVFTKTLNDDKICSLPRCVIGMDFSIKILIPASSKETVINRVQLASSVSELNRV